MQEQRKQRRRRILATLGLLALALMFAYMFVWQRVYTLQLAEEYSHRKQNVRLLKEKCQALQFEVELLSSLENIESIARNDLNMMPLREAQFAKAIVPAEKKPAPVEKNIEAPKPEPAAKPAVTKKASIEKKAPTKTTTKAKSTKPVTKKTNTKKSKGSGRAGA